MRQATLRQGPSPRPKVQNREVLDSGLSVEGPGRKAGPFVKKKLFLINYCWGGIFLFVRFLKNKTNSGTAILMVQLL